MELTRLNISDSVLSGNIMPCVFYITPWNDTLQRSALFVIITVAMEVARESEAYIEIYNQKMIPGGDGDLRIDLSSIVQPHLDYFTPTQSTTVPQEAVGQLKRFRVTATVIQDGFPAATDSYILTAIKAGAAIVEFNPQYFSLTEPVSWFEDKKGLLFAHENGELVFKQDALYLFFLKKEGITGFTAAYTLHYATAGGYAQVQGSIGGAIATSPSAQIFAVPVGFIAAGIADALPAGADAVYYTVEIKDNTGATIVNAVKYVLDYRQFYDARLLLYRNSLGGLQHLRLYGKADTLSEYQMEEVRSIQPPDYIVNNQVRAMLQQNNVEESPGTKANTGWLHRFEAARLRDFFLSRQKFELQNGKLVPIKINGNKITFYSNTDELISVDIEYSQAVLNRHYTTALPAANGGCPAVRFFKWRQTGGDEITAYWALPFGYNEAEITVTFPGEDPVYYNLEGNSGSQKIILERPATASGDVTLLITAHVVCSKKPLVTGPESDTPGQTYRAVIDIVVTDDVFTEKLKQPPFTFEKNLLDNDYDPAGEDLSTEVVPPTTVYVDGSSTQTIEYSISYDGKITISANSGGIFTKTLTYRVRRFSEDNSHYKTGNVVIKLTEGEAFIYAKIFIRNTSTSNGSTKGDVYAETFRDPECTVPLTVQNLTLLWTQTKMVWVTGYQTDTTTTDGTTLLNGNSVLLYSGQINYFNRGGGSSITYELRPSADYVKV